MNGSFVPEGVEAETAPFLNHMQIREKHGLSAARYRAYEKADGAHRDILNYLVATSH